MEQLAVDTAQVFKNYLLEYFAEILKHIPKKYKDFRDLIAKKQEEVLQEKDKKQTNANKYFLIFKLSIEARIAKLTQLSIFYIEKLIAHKFIDGNGFDYTQEIAPLEGADKRKITPIDRNRKLIETIIEVICESVNLKDEHVHLQIIRSLLTIATSPVCQVHGQALERIMRTIIQIHCTAKQPQIQDPSKHAFTQIIVETFKRMERKTILSQEESAVYQQKKAIGGLASIPQSNTLLAHKHESQVNSSSDLDLSGGSNANNNNINNNNNSINVNGNANNNSGESLNQLAGTISVEQQKQLISSYVGRVTLSLVDDVCIYEDKVTRVNARMQSENADNAAIDAELALIPLKSVPNPTDVDTPQYKKAIIAQVQNEKNAIAGKFGWCFICREEASKFCKDTRVPICSNECKQKHIDEVARITRFCYSGQEVAVNPHITDALTVFNFLCRVSQEDPANNLNAMQVRQKVIILELILAVMESAGAVFLSRKEFASAVQENLLGSLLQNSLSMERQVYVLSFDIIANLIENFRANLKTEIAVFLENVFIRILESTNSAFAHRVACLRVFLKIFRIPRAVIEMFVNYDCQMDQSNIIERLIGLLTKISQGKYSKQEFSNLIQADQAIELKNLAIQSIAQLMSGINDFVTVCDEQQSSIVATVAAAAAATAAAAAASRDHQNSKDEVLEMSDGLSASASQGNHNKSGATIMEDVRDAIEIERQLKLEFQKGIQKFNLKAKVGIKHWITQGLIEEGNAKDLADIFYKHNKQISHEKIGEVFGSSDEFHRKVLAEFIENLAFEDQDLVNSLRRFLTYFQLPGEGEQVDRILEKFGEKYSLDNPNSYKDAGTPYTLSYALMMLHTSTHSQQVLEKERMTLPQFQKLIKKIDNGQDLPDEITLRMFQEIKKSPLGIHHLEESKKALEDALNMSQSKKQELFMKETEQIFEKGKLMIQSGKDTKSYIMVFTKDYVASLLQIVWSAVFASLSQAMIEQENIEMVNTILVGFRSSIRLLGQFGMVTERETFVFELCRLTGLFTPHKLIRPKNVQAIKATLLVSTQCRNCLGRSWKIILECLSKLDNYFLIGQNLRRDVDVMHTEIQVENNLIKEEVDKYNSQVIIKYLDQSEIDKIFHCSNLFDGETIVEFIRCLCELSQEELEDAKNPRIFCIQRIGEVTEFNMQRVRIVWNKIWEILKAHYNRIGCHQNPWVSSLAIDSLKQLSVKFLEKPELQHYQFQKDFLSPFEYIFQNYPHQGSEIKELILSCLSMMTNSRALHLRSGWKTILRVVNLTLQEDNPRLVELAVSITDVIMNQKSLDNLMEVFGDLIHALTSQTKYKIESIAVKALEYLKKCIEYLVENTIRDQLESQKKLQQQQSSSLSMQQQQDSIENSSPNIAAAESLAPAGVHAAQPTTKKTQILISESKKLLEGYLIPILSNFASFFSDERPKMIGKSVAYLFQSIAQYSYTFNAEFWSLILGGALRPLFDDMQFIFSKSRFASQEVYKASKNAAQLAFQEFVALMADRFDTLHHCLPDFFSIMHNSIAINQETLSTISLNSLMSFLSLSGSKLNASEWDIIINSLVQLSVNCQPEEILAARSHSNEFNIPIEELLAAPVEYKKYAMKIDFQKNIVQCVIFKNMITFIIDMFERFSSHFTDAQIDTITNILQNHLTFADEFNSRIYLRFYLWKNGLNSGLETLPVLGRQEKLSRCGILLIQYEQYKRNPSGGKYLDLFLTSTETYLKALRDILQELRSIEKSQKAAASASAGAQNGVNSKTEGQQQQQPRVVGGGVATHSSNGDTVNLNEILKGHLVEEKKRQVKSLRHIIGTSILPNLNDIHPTQFETRLQSLVNLLIDVSNQDLSFEDGFNHNLKILLAKFFNHIFSLIPQKPHE